MASWERGARRGVGPGGTAAPGDGEARDQREARCGGLACGVGRACCGRGDARRRPGGFCWVLGRWVRLESVGLGLG